MRRLCTSCYLPVKAAFTDREKIVNVCSVVVAVVAVLVAAAGTVVATAGAVLVAGTVRWLVPISLYRSCGSGGGGSGGGSGGNGAGSSGNGGGADHSPHPFWSFANKKS